MSNFFQLRRGVRLGRTATPLLPRRMQFSIRARHLDTVFKIDYNNGSGTGAIIWKLGKNGDFQYQSTDPYPWFSHQHDPNIDANGNLLVYDNGNTRFAADQTIHSRGQVISLDEKNRTATLLLNVDLGAASLALGAAQLLPNGNYHFDSGWVADNGNAAWNDEVDKTGAKTYSLKFQTILYRSFRMRACTSRRLPPSPQSPDDHGLS